MTADGEKDFRLLADNAPVMIWRSGVDALCDYFNKPWLDFTGKSLDQEVGEGWAAGVHPDDLPRCMDTYLGAFEKRAPFSMEYRLRRHDGAYRWLLDNGAPYQRDGAFAGYFGSCIDITDQKEAHARLEALVAERDVLLAEMQHRVRNNLQSMSGLIDISLASTSRAHTPEFLRLARRVRAYAYIQQALHRPDRAAGVDLAVLWAEIGGRFLALAGRPNVAFTVEGGPLTVSMRRATDITLALGEILDAAATYGYAAQETGTVRARLIADSPQRIVIEDDGPGRAEPEKPRGDERLMRAYAHACFTKLQMEPLAEGVRAMLTLQDLPE